MAEEERQTLSGDEEEKQRGGQQEGAGPSEAAAAAGGVFRQERLRRLVQRIIWGIMRDGATASHEENKHLQLLSQRGAKETPPPAKAEQPITGEDTHCWA